MATAYRVTAPYVVLKIRDPLSGTAMMNGFYADNIVTDDRVEAATLKRHLERGWLEKVDVPAAEPAKSETPVPDPDKVPDGTADEVLAWVGDNKERAELALAAEQAGQKRKTLVDQLKKRAGQA